MGHIGCSDPVHPQLAFGIMGPGTHIDFWDAETHGIFWKMRFMAKLVDIGCIQHFPSEYKQGDCIITHHHTTD